MKEILPMENRTTVYDTGTVYIIFPEYSDVSLVCETRPSKSDESVTWCSGAAFQHDISLGFSHGNIDGDHAVDGVLYESPNNKDSFAAFTFANGRCFVGDLEPFEYIEAYADHERLAEDWRQIMARKPRMIHFAHAPQREVHAL